MLKPGSVEGDHTRPASVVWPFSGFRNGLAVIGLGSGLIVRFAVSPAPFGTPEQQVKGSVTEPLLTRAPANSSARLGARTSRDCRARTRRPSSGVSQVRPAFQVLESPAVERSEERPVG